MKLIYDVDTGGDSILDIILDNQFDAAMGDRLLYQGVGKYLSLCSISVDWCNSI